MMADFEEDEYDVILFGSEGHLGVVDSRPFPGASGLGMGDVKSMQTCPYYEAHVVGSGRFAKHVNACRMSVPDYVRSQFEVCPYNATHHIRTYQMTLHLEICPDKAANAGGVQALTDEFYEDLDALVIRRQREIENQDRQMAEQAAKAKAELEKQEKEAGNKLVDNEAAAGTTEVDINDLSFLLAESSLKEDKAKFVAKWLEDGEIPESSLEEGELEVSGVEEGEIFDY